MLVANLLPRHVQRVKRFYLFQTVDLHVDESSFTGETEPVAKSIHNLSGSPRHGSQSSKTNIVFMGTLVRCGSGKVTHSVVSFLS